MGKDDYRWPTFTLPHQPRHPTQTDEQYAAGVRETEEYYEILGVYLGLAQQLATHGQLYRTCKRRGCRRARRCVGRYPQHDWHKVDLGPIIPPCVSRDRDYIKEFRAVIRRELRYRIDQEENEPPA